jgi:hypothetical protein
VGEEVWRPFCVFAVRLEVLILFAPLPCLLSFLLLYLLPGQRSLIRLDTLSVRREDGGERMRDNQTR